MGGSARSRRIGTSIAYRRRAAAVPDPQHPRGFGRSGRSHSQLHSRAGTLIAFATTPRERLAIGSKYPLEMMKAPIPGAFTLLERKSVRYLGMFGLP